MRHRPPRLRLALVALIGLLGLLAGCASFPDEGPRNWQEKTEGQGELGGPPSVQEAPGSEPDDQNGDGSPDPGAPQVPSGCDDPDPQVVATCLDPVGAVAVLPNGVSALVGERATGRVLRVERGKDPVLVTTVPVDTAGGGGLTGLVLSPSYEEDQLVYAYATTPEDNRVLRLAPNEPPKPVLTGIPKGPSGNGGALGTDVGNTLLVATGNAGDPAPPPTALNGKVLRIDTLGRPAAANPNPGSPVLSTGLAQPGGICTDPTSESVWVTDRAPSRDVLYRVAPGPLGPAAWTWPDRPGVAGCMTQPGVVAVALTGGAALSVLRPADDGSFSGAPETLLINVYGRLNAATLGSDGLLWLGTVNKSGGKPVASDDRVIRIQPPSGGGASRA
ncbi:PQQ-dependent sugar dehydrogenase [Pseudonocardia kujensis]|uniref:PQQ-dependent sugar dehydrogenase n=1 Tax=Pseudonocardia kujensis TaxID=1128675 RepID=UPI001E573466|nr:PQQ-dependent sugar dehydrogenase [Pseudonocardia kujensis]MCE0764049.1 PQQ-dependent sugar dehydrogenase [Pseudonocardia kujensis]